MKFKNLLLIVLLFGIPYLTWSEPVQSKSQDIYQLVAESPEKGWWHKTFNSMDGNRYLLSFDSQKHAGKLNWEKTDFDCGFGILDFGLVIGIRHHPNFFNPKSAIRDPKSPDAVTPVRQYTNLVNCTNN
jgi:hypothetical protein